MNSTNHKPAYVFGWLVHLIGFYLLTGALAGLANPWMAAPARGRGAPADIAAPLLMLAAIAVGIILLARWILIRYSHDKTLARNLWSRRFFLTLVVAGMVAIFCGLLF